MKTFSENANELMRAWIKSKQSLKAMYVGECADRIKDENKEENMENVKSLLTTGDRVTLRDGRLKIVMLDTGVGDLLSGTHVSLSLQAYKDDLTHPESDWDIMKIERIVNGNVIACMNTIDNWLWEPIYEREEPKIVLETEIGNAIEIPNNVKTIVFKSECKLRSEDLIVYESILSKKMNKKCVVINPDVDIVALKY